MKHGKLTLAALAVLLACHTGCAAAGEQEAPPDRVEGNMDHSMDSHSEFSPESSEEAVEEEWEEPEEEAELEEEIWSAPFAIPQVEHPLAEELTALLDGFSHEYLFPAFDSVEELPYYEPTLSTNLLTDVYLLNDEYLALGSGVDEAEYARLQESGMYSMFVRYEDLNHRGRHFFGDAFSMPFSECYEVGPVEGESDYFAFLRGRGGMSSDRYVARSVEEVSHGVVEATFYAFSFNYSWETGEPMSAIALADRGDADYFMSECGFLECPEGTGYQDIVHERELFQYLRLTIPQEELGYLTVTFQQQPDGRYTTAACRYTYRNAE